MSATGARQSRPVSGPGWADAWQVDAALLDVHGVLVDTAAAQRATWHWWAGRVGLDPEVVHAATWGVPDRVALERLLPPGDVEAALAAVSTRRRVLLATARKVRGAVSLVRSLPPKRWAIVTSASEEDLAVLLRRLRLDPPTIVITAAIPGRPGPSAHLVAAERLGYAPSACVAFESSPAGVMAARAAGAITVGIGRHEDLPSLHAAHAARTDVGGVQVQLLDDGRLQVRAFREPHLPSLRRDRR